MATEIGTLSGGAVQTTRRVYRTQGQATIEYVLNSSDEAAFLGSYTIGTSAYDGLLLASVNTDSFKGVTRARLEYVTEEELVNLRYGGTGTSKASDSNSSTDENGDVFPQPTYTYTQIVNAVTFDEATIIEGVGKTSDPTGMTTPTTGWWLKTSKSIRPQGDKYQITETWQYKEFGW